MITSTYVSLTKLSPSDAVFLLYPIISIRIINDDILIDHLKCLTSFFTMKIFSIYKSRLFETVIISSQSKHSINQLIYITIDS